MKQTLTNLLADGKTKRVIDELRQLTAQDGDENNRVTVLATSYAPYRFQRPMI